MTPLEAVLAKLPDARRNGTGWQAKCPAHDDQRPSLSISEGDDQRVLLCCHRGCSVEDIMAAMGMTPRDLFPPKSSGNGHPATAKRPPRTFAKAAEAVRELERQHGARSALWTYYDGHGEPVGVIVRWDGPDGKDIRPVSRHGSGWIIGAMRSPRPLYRFGALAEAKRVFVTEGEPAADAVATLGLCATTSAGGAEAARFTDWQPLAGKSVTILPDHDDAGEHYAADAVALLEALNPRPMIRVVRLPGLPPKGDGVQYVEACRAAGLEDAAIRAELEALADAAPPVEPEAVEAEPPDVYRPFPLATLPDVLEHFVVETSAALGCDPAFVALPTLATVASCIGTTRAVELKRSWTEPAVVWAGVVARSGTLKSPAMDAATLPLRYAQADRMREHAEATTTYKVARLEYEKALAMWKRKASDSDPPEEPAAPVATRYVLSDCTIEAIAPVLAGNPRGVLVARDELSGWVRSFGQYKAGKGSDAAGWLELWRAGTLIVDRKASAMPTIYIPRAAASVCGTVQPGVLVNTLTSEHFESGLAARLLLVKPPDRLKRWSDRIPPRRVTEAYESLIRDLLALQHVKGEHGAEPARLPLSREARALWTAWYDVHARRIHEAGSDSEAAALAKVEAYAARFGLIFALCVNPHAVEVSANAIRGGTILADWFAGESRRVYALFTESEEDRDQRALVRWIERRGDAVTVRDLTHGLRQYRGKASEARAALDRLVKAGLGRWTNEAPGPKGGPPAARFELVTGVTVTTTPAHDAENVGYGDGDSGDGPQNHGPDAGSDPSDRPPDDLPNDLADGAVGEQEGDETWTF